MKSSLLLSIVTLALVTCPALAQEQGPPMPQPTKHHEVLKGEVGVWDAEVAFWMAGPDAEPARSQAVETNRLIGGMWVISDFEGTFGGMKFLGHGQLGYDPAKKKYVGTWVDGMAPTLMLMEGTYDEDTQTMIMFSEGVDPQTGKMQTMRNTTRYLSDDEKIMTMATAPAGSDAFVKVMEIRYKRRKSGK